MRSARRDKSAADDTDHESDAVDPKIVWQRNMQLRRARASIWLTCESIGWHNSVILLNAALREALDRLDDA